MSACRRLHFSIHGWYRPHFKNLRFAGLRRTVVPAPFDRNKITVHRNKITASHSDGRRDAGIACVKLSPILGFLLPARHRGAMLDYNPSRPYLPTDQPSPGKT